MSGFSGYGFWAAMRFLMLAWVLAVLGCARIGSVQESHPQDFYQIPRKLPGYQLDRDPRLIIYGDNRPGWRVSEVLGKKQTWLTWKQLYLPIVYQLYLVGTGVVGSVNYVMWNPDYGNTEARMVRDSIYARAGKDSIDLIFNTGDIVTDGRRPRDWKRFIEQYSEAVPVVLDYPYLPVSGNHDRTADSTYGMPNFSTVFSYPLFYVFECPDIDFFVLDSNFLIDQHGYLSNESQNEIFEEWFVSSPGEEPSWLERELEKSRKPFKAIIMHHPPIAYSEHYDDWGNPKYGPDLLEKRAALIALFQRAGVQVVFAGHEHGYQRNTLRYDDPSGGERAISFVTTGGGGAPLRTEPPPARQAAHTVAYAGEGFDVTPNVHETVYNYCVVDVTPSQISIEAVALSKNGDTDGRVIDRLIVTRTGNQKP